MAQRILSIIPHKTNDLRLNEKGTKIFGVGDFEVSTNLSSTPAFLLPTPKLSEEFTLNSSLNAITSSSKSTSTSSEDSPPVFNYDKTEPKFYARYGSLVERFRVALEQIILNFPAAINVTTEAFNQVGYNLYNITYNSKEDISTFFVEVSYFSNPFGIYFLKNINSGQDGVPKERNLTTNYNLFEIYLNGESYNILDFEGSETIRNSLAKFTVKGQPFEYGNTLQNFYIKLREDVINSIYEDLDDLESYLINRENNYSAVFQDEKLTEEGIFLDFLIKFVFPKFDQFNIDVISTAYEDYVDDFLGFAEKVDEKYSNVIMRKLIPENVQSVDLESGNGFPTFGKINSLLVVYGREIDELYKEIENIKFFNNVSYNKKNNLPDNLLKNLAGTLGWEVVLTEKYNIDFWRNLVINTWWVWKSKGTRNAIEFIFDYLGIPSEIYDLNEFVYVAKNPIDVDRFQFYLSLIDENLDVDDFPVDSEGYPVFIPNSDEYYFQTFGVEDNGVSYFAPYFNLLPEFTGSSVNYTAKTVSTEVLFEQVYEFSGNTLDYSLIKDSLVNDSCFISSGETVLDPLPEDILDVCGCPLPISDKTLKISVDQKNLYTGCTNIIADVFFTCISGDSVILNVNTFGGYPPYSYVGNSDGDILSTGDTYSFKVVDSKGCESILYTGDVICIDPCLDVEINVNFGYTCVLDEFGRNTGEAILSISASGGQPPYEYIGSQSGETVNHDEIVTVEVIDANGCSSGLVGITIDCPPPEDIECADISLNSTLETVDTESTNKYAQLAWTYDVSGLANNVFVTGVTVTSTQINPVTNYLIGSPVTTSFQSKNGAERYDFDFTPDDISSSLEMQHELEILTSNGCVYTTTYTLTVDPRQLGNSDSHNEILNP